MTTTLNGIACVDDAPGRRGRTGAGAPTPLASSSTTNPTPAGTRVGIRTRAPGSAALPAPGAFAYASAVDDAVVDAGGAMSRPVVTMRARRVVGQDAGLDAGLDELLIAVGFGSVPGVRPSRLRAVPAPVEVPAPSSVGARVIVMPRPMPTSGPRMRAFPEPAPPATLATSAHNALSTSPGCRVLAPVESVALQLTARGRVVLVVVAAVVGVAVVIAAWFGAGASSRPAPVAVPARVVVHSGDTLWTIAGRIAPNRDPRAVVAQLLQLNHLDTPGLVPGQVLRTH